METLTLARLNDAPVTAYLGLGSNLGDRFASLKETINRLSDAETVTVVQSSSIYETAPWGYTDQPDFLNCALEIETRLTPLSLFRRIEEVEREVGRVPSWRYGPRLIDIDILLYGDLCLQLPDPDLVVPHPRLHQRAFVLIPLAEIAENVIHPGLHRSISSLASCVEEQESITLWAPPPEIAGQE